MIGFYFYVAGLHLSAIVKLQALCALIMVGYGKLMEIYVSYLNLSIFVSYIHAQLS